MLEDEECEKAKLEEEIEMLQSQLLQISFEADQVTRLSNHNLDSMILTVQEIKYRMYILPPFSCQSLFSFIIIFFSFLFALFLGQGWAKVDN